MIQFNNLEFLTSNTLHIDAEVRNLGYYDSVYIDSIIIDTEDTVTETGPSDNPPYQLAVEDTKHLNTTIDVSGLVKDGPKMLFVYIHCDGIPRADTPCGLDNQESLGVVVDYQYVYNTTIKLAKCIQKCGCLDGNCSIDVSFANFALQYFRMKSSIENGNWTTAFEAYSWLMRKNSTGDVIVASKKCGCNG